MKKIILITLSFIIFSGILSAEDIFYVDSSANTVVNPKSEIHFAGGRHSRDREHRRRHRHGERRKRRSFYFYYDSGTRHYEPYYDSGVRYYDPYYGYEYYRPSYRPYPGYCN